MTRRHQCKSRRRSIFERRAGASEPVIATEDQQLKALNSFIFTCLIDFTKAKTGLVIAKISRMSRFSVKFDGGRDNCDAKDFIAFCNANNRDIRNLCNQSLGQFSLQIRRYYC